MLLSPISTTILIFFSIASSAPVAEDGRAAELLEKRKPNKCVADNQYGCNRNDVVNCINYLIAAGTKSITVTGGRQTVVCALNNCRVVGSITSGSTTSYA